MVHWIDLGKAAEGIFEQVCPILKRDYPQQNAHDGQNGEHREAAFSIASNLGLVAHLFAVVLFFLDAALIIAG